MGIDRNPPSVPEKDQPYWGIFEALSDGLIIQDSKTGRVVEANSAAAAMHGYSRDEFIGLYPQDYVQPDSRQLSRDSGQIIASGSMSESPAIHMHRDGSRFRVEVRTTAFTYRSRACRVSMVRDISERVQVEQLLYGQVEVRQREQSTLLDISHILASTLELKPDLILDQLHI